MIAEAKRPIRRSKAPRLDKENEVVDILTKYGLDVLPPHYKTPTNIYEDEESSEVSLNLGDYA